MTTTGTIAVSWAAPTTHVDGSPVSEGEVTGYVINLLDALTGAVLQTATVPANVTQPYNIAVATPGGYQVTVTAQDTLPVQNSLPASTLAVWALPVPEPPTNLTVSVQTSFPVEVILNWTAPTKTTDGRTFPGMTGPGFGPNGVVALGYTVSQNGNFVAAIQPSTSGVPAPTTYTLYQPANGQYAFTVTASLYVVNAGTVGGESGPSASSNAVVVSIPPKPSLAPPSSVLASVAINQ